MKTVHQNCLKKLLAPAGICAAVWLAALQVHAQPVYRVVGADGRVTFSDKPPAASDKATVLGPGGRTVTGGNTSLPFELRQIAGKYPVTFYTGNNCGPCGTGRTMLTTRGIPFTEKTVSTAEDIQALQRISGENSLPFLTIGNQQIKGYSEAEWTQFLSAAGYPQSSLLPSAYRNPEATPLVSVQKSAQVTTPAETQAPHAPVEASRPPVDTTSNPAGIKF